MGKALVGHLLRIGREFFWQTLQILQHNKSASQNACHVCSANLTLSLMPKTLPANFWMSFRVRKRGFSCSGFFGSLSLDLSQVGPLAKSSRAPAMEPVWISCWALWEASLEAPYFGSWAF